MKILFLTNNPISQPIIDWLVGEAGERVLVYADRLTEEKLSELKPEFIVSYNYKHKIPNEVIEYAPTRIVNLHTAYLPYNRGADPIFWSLMEETPLGITIHLVDEEWDTGDILYQEKYEIKSAEMDFSKIYELMHKKMRKLFVSRWAHMRLGKTTRIPQRGAGTFHYTKELNMIRDQVLINGWETIVGVAKVRYNSLISN